MTWPDIENNVSTNSHKLSEDINLIWYSYSHIYRNHTKRSSYQHSEHKSFQSSGSAHWSIPSRHVALEGSLREAGTAGGAARQVLWGKRWRKTWMKNLLNGIDRDVLITLPQVSSTLHLLSSLTESFHAAGCSHPPFSTHPHPHPHLPHTHHPPFLPTTGIPFASLLSLTQFSPLPFPSLPCTSLTLIYASLSHPLLGTPLCLLSLLVPCLSPCPYPSLQLSLNLSTASLDTQWHPYLDLLLDSVTVSSQTFFLLI